MIYYYYFIYLFSVEVNMPLVAAMAAMTVLTMFGVAFMALRNRSHGSRYY